MSPFSPNVEAAAGTSVPACGDARFFLGKNAYLSCSYEFGKVAHGILPDPFHHHHRKDGVGATLELKMLVAVVAHRITEKFNSPDLLG